MKSCVSLEEESNMLKINNLNANVQKMGGNVGGERCS